MQSFSINSRIIISWISTKFFFFYSFLLIIYNRFVFILSLCFVCVCVFDILKLIFLKTQHVTCFGASFRLDGHNCRQFAVGLWRLLQKKIVLQNILNLQKQSRGRRRVENPKNSFNTSRTSIMKLVCNAKQIELNARDYDVFSVFLFFFFQGKIQIDNFFFWTTTATATEK